MNVAERARAQSCLHDSRALCSDSGRVFWSWERVVVSVGRLQFHSTLEDRCPAQSNPASNPRPSEQLLIHPTLRRRLLILAFAGAAGGPDVARLRSHRLRVCESMPRGAPLPSPNLSMAAVDDGTQTQVAEQTNGRAFGQEIASLYTNVVEDLRDWLGGPQDCLAM